MQQYRFGPGIWYMTNYHASLYSTTEMEHSSNNYIIYKKLAFLTSSTFVFYIRLIDRNFFLAFNISRIIWNRLLVQQILPGFQFFHGNTGTSAILEVTLFVTTLWVWAWQQHQLPYSGLLLGSSC